MNNTKRLSETLKISLPTAREYKAACVAMGKAASEAGESLNSFVAACKNIKVNDKYE